MGFYFLVQVQIAQIQLPPGVKEKLQQQLAKLPPEQQELFKKHQPQVLLRLQQQLMKQQQGGAPATGITKIPITVNVRSTISLSAEFHELHVSGNRQ